MNYDITLVYDDSHGHRHEETRYEVSEAEVADAVTEAVTYARGFTCEFDLRFRSLE